MPMQRKVMKKLMMAERRRQQKSIRSLIIKRNMTNRRLVKPFLKMTQI